MEKSLSILCMALLSLNAFSQQCISTSDVQNLFVIDKKVYSEITTAETMLKKNEFLLKGNVDESTRLNVVNTAQIKSSISASKAKKKDKVFLESLNVECIEEAYRNQLAQLDSIVNTVGNFCDLLASKTMDGAKMMADSVNALSKSWTFDTLYTSGSVNKFKYRDGNKSNTVNVVKYMYDNGAVYVLKETAYLSYSDAFAIWSTLIEPSANKDAIAKKWSHKAKIKALGHKYEYLLIRDREYWQIRLN